MFKKILKRAMAEAMHGGYRSGKPWKKGKYGRHWHGTGYGPGPGYGPYGHDPYRQDPTGYGGYGGDYRGGHGGGYPRSRGLKGLLIDGVIRWLSRRR